MHRAGFTSAFSICIWFSVFSFSCDFRPAISILLLFFHSFDEPCDQFGIFTDLNPAASVLPPANYFHFLRDQNQFEELEQNFLLELILRHRNSSRQ